MAAVDEQFPSLRCNLCEEAFNITQRMPLEPECGHKICKECLPKIQRKAEELFIPCPFCRREFAMNDYKTANETFRKAVEFQVRKEKLQYDFCHDETLKCSRQHCEEKIIRLKELSVALCCLRLPPPNDMSIKNYLLKVALCPECSILHEVCHATSDSEPSFCNLSQILSTKDDLLIYAEEFFNLKKMKKKQDDVTCLLLLLLWRQQVSMTKFVPDSVHLEHIIFRFVESGEMNVNKRHLKLLLYYNYMQLLQELQKKLSSLSLLDVSAICKFVNVVHEINKSSAISDIWAVIWPSCVLPIIVYCGQKLSTVDDSFTALRIQGMKRIQFLLHSNAKLNGSFKNHLELALKEIQDVYKFCNAAPRDKYVMSDASNYQKELRKLLEDSAILMVGD